MRSDHELLESWRGGDRVAGNLLFKRHFEAIYRYFRNKVGEGVEDLVQRTFIACVEGRDRFRQDASVRTYLFGIAHNILHDNFRRQRRLGQVVDLDEVSIEDLGVSVSVILAARDEEQLLVRALRRIPVASQEILELFYWEGLTGQELGDILGVPEDTARSRLRRARQLLEAALKTLRASPTLLSSTLADLDAWARGLREQIMARS